MAEDTERKVFNFKHIKLFKSETLGTGSYGIACKAKCDQLLCAAKIIYPVLLEVQDQSLKSEEQKHMTPYERFEQECHFLSQISHPNIVQYIQTYREPETGSAVLLMELMDESLTHFLQSTTGNIPVHVQINICHDVVLALSFLHSNGMIHRDLSSNNILLNNGGARAKVTDFGMSVFMENSGSRTLCPGTVAYMPPEALNEPPIHTDKLDCFSFGCCVIQICTRIWPEPKPRFSTYQVQDPRNPSQTTEAQFSVPEIDRRASHIQMINTADPLRPVALDCLKNKEEDRPSAAELCVVIEGLKETQEYQASTSTISRVSLDDNRLTEKGNQLEKQQKLHESEMKRLRSTVEDAHQDIRERNEMLVIRARQLQKVSTSLAEKERENERLRSSIAFDGSSIMKQDEQIQSLEEQLGRLEEENSRLKHQLEVQDQTIRDQQQISKNDDYQLRNVQYDLSSTATLLKQVTHQLNQAMILIQEKDRMFSNKKREIRQLEELLLIKVNSFQESLEWKRKNIQDLEEQIAVKDQYIAGLKRDLKSPTDRFKPTPVPRQSRSIPIAIRRGDVTAPLQMHAGSFVTINSSVFLRPYDRKEVYKLNVHSYQWTTLPECPTTAFTLASIQGNLAALGGRGSKVVHNICEVNGNQKWVESYPQMIHERASSCAASDANVLVVAGGLNSDFTALSSVEVLSFTSLSWNIVTSLPYSLHSASATICGDDIYIGGGYYMKSRSLYSALTCNLNVLMSTAIDNTRKSFSLPHDLSSNNRKWKHIANLPVCCSTFTSVQDNLVAVGGKNIDGVFSNTVYKYNISTLAWEESTFMQSGRSNCLIGTLSNKIVVVGGCCEEGISDKVEMITV